MRHMLEVGNTCTYNISVENLNGRDPLHTLAFTETLITPICSLNLYFTTILIMKNRCIGGNSFKVILTLDLTSDNNKEFKLLCMTHFIEV